MFVHIGAVGHPELRNDVSLHACFTGYEFCEDTVESRMAVLDMRVDASRTFGVISCPATFEVVKVRVL